MEHVHALQGQDVKTLAFLGQNVMAYRANGLGFWRPWRCRHWRCRSANARSLLHAWQGWAWHSWWKGEQWARCGFWRRWRLHPIALLPHAAVRLALVPNRVIQVPPPLIAKRLHPMTSVGIANHVQDSPLPLNLADPTVLPRRQLRFDQFWGGAPCDKFPRRPGFAFASSSDLRWYSNNFWCNCWV